MFVSLGAISLMYLSSEGTESSGGLPSFPNFFGRPSLDGADGGLPSHSLNVSLCVCALCYFKVLSCDSR